MARSARILQRCVVETLEARNLLSSSFLDDWGDYLSDWSDNAQDIPADTQPAMPADEPTTSTQPAPSANTQPASQPTSQPATGTDTPSPTQPEATPTPEEPPVTPWDGTDSTSDSSLPEWDIGVSLDASGGSTGCPATTAPTIYPDAYEYDDQAQLARPIRTDWAPQYHTIDRADDVDWVYFDVPSRAEVVAETDGTSGDTEMWLFSGNDLQNAIAYDNNGGHGEFSRIAREGHHAEPAGRYFVAVASHDGALIDQYSLRVAVRPQDAQADPVFNENYYLAHNPDVQQAITFGQVATGWDHFVLYGQFEGRQPSLYFNEGYYRQTNPDVAAAIRRGDFASGWQHFEQFGLREGRQGSPYFNDAAYLSANPDVAAGVASGQVRSGLDHFLLFGQFELRATGSGFDGAYYLAHNPDVAAAVAAGQMTAYAHFINYGQFENRRPGPAYDEAAYLARYADVAAAVASGAFRSGWEHWVQFGMREGRIAV